MFGVLGQGFATERQAREFSHPLRTAAVRGLAVVAALLALLAPVPASAGLTAPATDDDGVFEVTWSEIDCSQNCRLTQRKDDGGFSEIVRAAAPTNSHSVNVSAESPANFAYRIATCQVLQSLGGEVCLPFALKSPWQATTVVGAPVSPTNLTLTEGGTAGNYTLSWTAGSSDSTVTYKLAERDGRGLWTSIYAGAGLSVTLSRSEPATYYYKVQACHGTACSAPSNTVMTVLGTEEPQRETTTVPGSLPYGTGVTRGGDSYINIPIAPAPGVNGLAPRLSIDYSGGRQRQQTYEQLPGDAIGYGWRIGGFSAIRRCVVNQPNSATVNLTDSDSLCLDGEPLVLVGGTHFADGAEYRTLRESFLKITLHVGMSEEGEPNPWQSWFEVLTPDGMRREYGRTEESRLRHINYLVINANLHRSPTLPFLWSIDREEDAFGNVMAYSYYEDELAAVRHPRRIAYGDSGDAEVLFDYIGRTDLAAVNLDDFDQQQHLLLHGVRVRLDGKQLRHYRLISETAASGWRRLKLVQLCAHDDPDEGGTLQCLAPLELNWEEPPTAMPEVTTRVTEVTDPLGQETKFYYKGLSEPAVGAMTASSSAGGMAAGGAWPFPPLGKVEGTKALVAESGTVKEVVWRVRRSNGLGGWRDTDYEYQGVPRRSTMNWGLLGFDGLSERDSATGLNTYRSYRMDFPHLGDEVAVRVYDRAHTDAGVETLALVELTREAKTLSYDNGGTSVTTTLPYVRSRTAFRYEGGSLLGATRTKRALTVSGAAGSQFVTAMTDVTETASGISTTSDGPSWGANPTVLRKAEVTTNFTNETDGAWLIGFENDVTRSDYGGDALLLDRTRKTTFTRWPDTNRVKTATRFPGHATLELTTTLGYDSDGNLTGSTVSGCGPGCNVESRSESAGSFLSSRYPSTLTNAEGHSQTMDYDARFGLPDSVTDANGRTTTAAYDGFGREQALTTPDGVVVTTSRNWCGAGGASCAAVWGVAPAYRETVSATVGPERRRYFDALGRLLRKEVASFGGGAWDRVDRRYDAQGRLRRESEPYAASSGEATAAPTNPSSCVDASGKPHRCIDRDQLGRPTAQHRADGGSVSLSYGVDPSDSARLRVTRTETVKASGGATTAGTLTTQRSYNLMGELGHLVEGDGANVAEQATDRVETAYAWDGSGLLKSATVDSTYVTSFEHDAAGNRTRVTNPNRAPVTFRHTALGELHQILDDKGTTTWTYDRLGRTVKRADADGVSEWQWDPANAKGALGKRCRHDADGATGCLALSAPDFLETYAYGSDARLDRAETALRAGGLERTYARSYTHDAHGRLSTVTHPSGLTVGHAYNARGYLWRLTDNADQSSLVTYSKANARGQTTEESYGNGTTTRRSFDARSGRLTGIDTALGAAAIQDDAYAWRTDGLLQSRRSGTGAAARTETFVHDRLGRLKEASTPLSGGGARTLSMAYDRLGNLTSRASSVAGDLDVAVTAFGAGPAAPGPTAATTVTVGASTHTLSYDAGGRVTRDDDGGADGTDRHFEWNARGLLKRAVAGASLADPAPESAEEYAYGPDGERYYRRSAWRDESGDGDPTHPVEHRFYVGSFEERIGAGAGGPRVETVRIAGAVLHTRTTGAAGDAAGAATVRESIRYLHRDHLGSVRAVTDADGTVVSRAAYDPFGGRRLPDGTREAGEAERAAAAGDAALDPARGFTGHEQLDRLGLVHMGGRVHDPRLGRFLSPDPVVGNPGSSQSWHAYSYVGNSPMSFTDPTGLVRAPMPWERDMCAGGTRCRNLNGGGGGFASGTARVEGSLSYVLWWENWYFVPNRSPVSDDARRDRYSVVMDAYFEFGSVRTFTDVAVPAEKQPGDRPIQIEVGDVVGTVVDFIPIVGDAKAFYEAYKDPTPINVTVAIIGVFGPLGDAAGKALKAGAKLADAAESASDAAKGSVDFFKGSRFSDKVRAQMQQDDFHSFPRSVEGFQDSGKVTKLKGSDGVTREKLEIPGGFKGKEGKFEFIKEPDGTINHRFFRPNGQ